jgi:hypothetical protein
MNEQFGAMDTQGLGMVPMVIEQSGGASARTTFTRVCSRSA